MKVLVTGGAGFIGSTVGSALLDRGHVPVILDDLSTGRESFTAGRAFYRGDVADGRLVDRIFAEHPDITAAVHCAGVIVVPESVRQPLRYYRENLAKAVTLVGHLTRNGCHRVLFSSTAALYRPGPDFAVDETSPIDPTSPYARSKAMVEQVLADAAAAGEVNVIALRYFNPIGADPLFRTGLQLRDPSHALGRMIEAWHGGETFRVTGVGWPTRDGTAIRDYVHVWDLAEAHVAALTRFDEVVAAERAGFVALNVGTGAGTTVRELVAAFEEVTGAPLPYRETGPRPGDVAGVFNRSRLGQHLLRWQPRYGVTDAIRHALRWREVDATSRPDPPRSGDSPAPAAGLSGVGPAGRPPVAG
ncbi:UDP-glucose 4-epimerase GalE [Micromonospora sp. WMMD882]|uniref:UDP-glucose 4-epimerase GalE n=1 Tax=Micromonospora sp. WMMD882 TaxID=3015151 RepID=UPI00248AD367|nr:UDP-glucose 4-epimerase GalE [Micromonospora sp. WMMD882]WBB79422.1 UDP-glucose 4-epimerase GalE [Micromonospora sp. WMMD882]